MASRAVGFSLRNNQNENALIGKKNEVVRFPQRRPALRDVSNKIGAQITQGALEKNLKKPDPKLTKTVDSAKDIINKLKISSKIEQTRGKIAPKVPPKPLKQQDTIIDKPTSYSAKQLVIYDPDENCKKDPLAVTEYVEEIFSYLREMEQKYAIPKEHLEDHKTTSNMRSTLVNWLVELQISFKLHLETTYMCVSLVDRYLARNKKVGKETLQLVGVAALMIAAKYEEIYIPDISDFVYVCDDSFTPRQILAMERDILADLHFGLGSPSPIHFLRRFSKVARANQLQHCLAKYLMELALLDSQMCYILPSHQAAAALCLSIAILSDETDLSKVWSPTLAHYTTYKLSDFKHVTRKFAMLLKEENKSRYQSVSEKYALASNHKISTNPKLSGRVVMSLLLEKL